ncbi:MAG TPA: hypothetical protein VFM10_08520, partial [Terriglobales bacterium]|nr:hypothetical protein [Terriglobales bacterium]
DKLCIGCDRFSSGARQLQPFLSKYVRQPHVDWPGCNSDRGTRTSSLENGTYITQPDGNLSSRVGN